MEDMYKVYARTDDAGRITAINSSAFLDDLTGWQEIDQGAGDRYHHAQGNYLQKPLMDDRGIFQFCLADGAVMERTGEEMNADCEEMEKPEQYDRIAELEKRLAAQEAELAAYREAYRQGVQSV